MRRARAGALSFERKCMGRKEWKAVEGGGDFHFAAYYPFPFSLVRSLHLSSVSLLFRSLLNRSLLKRKSGEMERKEIDLPFRPYFFHLPLFLSLHPKEKTGGEGGLQFRGRQRKRSRAPPSCFPHSKRRSPGPCRRQLTNGAESLHRLSFPPTPS